MKNPLTIVPREVTHPDISGLDAFLNEYNRQSNVADSTKYAFAAYDEQGTCLGALQGRYRTSAWAELNMLGVSQKGRGVGQKLVQQAEEFLKSKGCTAVCLSTLGNQAEGFYKKQGFVEYARLPKFAGEFDRIFMKKEL
jgi:N-acetylglutamate synthase-like GNAT family acetyltransferase